MKKYFGWIVVCAISQVFMVEARTIKIVIASESPQKVMAVQGAFCEKFIHDDLVFFAHKVVSGIPEQPVGYDAALKGIRNRLNNLPDRMEADYVIAIENYIEQSSVTQRWYDKGLVCVQEGSQETVIETKSVCIPDLYVQIAQQLSGKSSDLGYAITVGAAIQQSFVDRDVDPTNWQQEPEFGGVSRQQLLQDALDKILYADELNFLKSLVLFYPDYPKPGITFANFLPLIQSAKAFQVLIDLLVQRYENKNIDVIVGLESRGFILGAALAYKLGISFVPIRKPGKLPGATYSVDYKKEYGFDTLVIAQDGLQQGQRVLVIDDLIATGGSARAAIELVQLAGGLPVEFVSILKVSELEELATLSIPSFNLID